MQQIPEFVEALGHLAGADAVAGQAARAFRAAFRALQHRFQARSRIGVKVRFRCVPTSKLRAKAH
ncbi:MAG: hypothetical protein ACYDDO_13550 [Acidiferrobacterales bacterium]